MQGQTREKGVDVLEETWREIYPLAPLREHGKEGTTGCADEDDKDGTNPRVGVSVPTATAAAVLVLSILEHFHCRCWEGEEVAQGWDRHL